jgi:cobalt/nickel transport system permease protein
VSGGHAHALYRHGSSVVHRLAPHLKILAAFGFVIAVVITPRRAFWAFGVYAALIVGFATAAGLGLRFMVTRLVVILPFLVAAATFPFLEGGQQWHGLSVEGLWDLWNVAAKASLGALASVVLASTTEAPDVVSGLEQLRVPVALTAIMGFMVRYLDVIAGEMSRMRIAMRSRGYEPRWLGEVGALGRGVGALFVRSFERGERVHRAMTSRGFSGRMPRERRAPTSWATVTAVLAIPAGVLAVAITAIGLS